MTKEQLIQKIQEADQAYYSNGSSTLSDYEYDAMKRALHELDPDNPLLNSLGEGHTQGFAKYRHERRMLSLDKVKEVDSDENRYAELEAWLESVDAPAEAVWLVEPKVDGVAAEALYENNKLVSVATRGNGDEGDIITDNVRQCFPPELTGPLPARFYLIGELYISKVEFERINKEQEEAEKPPFANPRNLCAGTVKSKEFLADRKVEFAMHGFKNLSADGEIATIHQAYDAVSNSGYPNLIVPHTMTVSEAVSCVRKNNRKAQEALPFCCDGVVLKLDNIALQESLGETEHHPRWAIAFKFLPELKETIVERIVWQLGAKTGKATPVAEITPVLLDGTVVSRVSLANAGQMQAKGIREGSKVLVEKANEIIPHIAVVLSGGCYTLPPTMSCPSCGTEMPLIPGKAADTADYICSNPNCPEKRVAMLLTALSSSSLNVLGVGPELCKAFIEKYLDDPEFDVLKLMTLGQQDYPATLSPLQRVNIYTEVQQGLQAPLHRWIVALQFPGIAAGTAKKIAQHCKDWNTFVEKVGAGDCKELGITQKQFDAINECMTKKAYKERLASIQLNPASDCVVEADEKQPLAGLAFVVTGTFDAGRKNIEQLIPQKGGVLRSSVSNKTNYLVYGEAVGATKLNKAKECGTALLSEAEFFAFLNEREQSC